MEWEGITYKMMKLEEVGRVPEDRIAIQRMVVLIHPSSLFYQLSFCPLQVTPGQTLLGL